MKEHRKPPSSIGYPPDGVKRDRHGNIRVSLRDKEKEKRKNLERDWERDSGKDDARERDKERLKLREKERSRREREIERARLLEAARERDRKRLKKLEKERLRHKKLEVRDRLNRVKRHHESGIRERSPPPLRASPVRGSIASPKSSSSRSLGEIRTRTPSESPPMSRLRSIVRSLPKSPLPSPPKSPSDHEKDDIESVEPLPSSSAGIAASPGVASTNETSESKSEPPILRPEDMSPISNNSSLGDIDEIESNHNSEVVALFGEDSKEPIKSEEIVSDENFSEWSEDEDELLNQPSNKTTVIEPLELSSEATPKAEDKMNKLKEDEEDAVKSFPLDSLPTESQDACSSFQDDALESISDDECDAIIGSEAAQETGSNSDSKGTPSRESLDALDIDWASLIQQPKIQPPDTGTSSARRRMSPANILSRIGFSHSYAGPEMTRKIIEYCKEELKDNFIPFKHPVAMLHTFISEQVSMRNNIFESNAFFSNALSARKDLDIRRILAQTFIDFQIHPQTQTKDGEIKIENESATQLVSVAPT